MSQCPACWPMTTDVSLPTNLGMAIVEPRPSGQWHVEAHQNGSFNFTSAAGLFWKLFVYLRSLSAWLQPQRTESVGLQRSRDRLRCDRGDESLSGQFHGSRQFHDRERSECGGPRHCLRGAGMEEQPNRSDWRTGESIPGRLRDGLDPHRHGDVHALPAVGRRRRSTSPPRAQDGISTTGRQRP